ncbi:TraY domain-containing protein [Escherichia coli]
MVKLQLPVDVESLLIETSNRSGRSRSVEAVIRLKDHLHH